MNIIETPLSGLLLIEPKVFADERGYFIETWQQQRYADAGIPANFVQDNHSSSQRGTLRGLHYQLEQAQGKLVRASRGAVYDVAVDMRKSSNTFGQWYGVELNDKNHRQLWVPSGFAHGFYVLSEEAEFQYKCTDYYSPTSERCLLWNDPEVGVAWPLQDSIETLISEKDKQGTTFAKADFYP